MKLRELEKELLSYGIEDARSEAYLILERLFGVGRAALLLDRERDFSSPELESTLKGRKERVPLQYIFGDWEFMGKKFFVSEDCLIPQPDTEILVEKALEILKKWHGVYEIDTRREADNVKATPVQFPSPCKKDSQCQGEGASPWVADLCTGSGCIGLSLMAYGELDEITLMDISEGALNMAKKNAQLHGLSEKCEFILGDIRCDMPKRKYRMIVSNPPYIPSGDIEELPEEVKKEPRLALDGGNDGLDLIRYLIGEGLSYLCENGVMLIEFGYDQGDIMDTLLRKKCDTGSIKSYEILHDYGGNPRVAVIYGN